MTLPGKISSVLFEILDGTTVISSHTITVSNLRHPWEMRFWEGRTGLSVTNKRRKKRIVRGFDTSLSFDWEDIRNQESDIIALIDDLKVASDNDYKIKFTVGVNTLLVVPESAIYNQDYINQIKRTPTSISFDVEELKDSITYA